MSIRAGLMRFLMKRAVRGPVEKAEDLVEFRNRMKEASSMSPKVPDRVSVVPVTANGVNCEWITADQTDQNRVLMYLHGGGYVLCGPDSHRDFGWRMAEASGMRVLMVDYRLAPENPFPAALEDATACYKWLLDEGFSPDRIAIGGDSAGGGLTIATMVNLKNLGMPLPSGAVVLSPWTDLSMSGDSIDTCDKTDSILSRIVLEKFASAYLGERDRRAPLASPLFAELSGLPPVLIHVSSDEVLLSDAERLAQRLREAGGEVSLEIWPKMPHMFHIYASRVPEGKKAIVELGKFLKLRTGGRHA